MGSFAFLSKIKKWFRSPKLCYSEVVSSLVAFTEGHFETLGDEAAFQNRSQNTSFGNHRQSDPYRLLFKRAEATCPAQQELVDSLGSRKENTLP